MFRSLNIHNDPIRCEPICCDPSVGLTEDDLLTVYTHLGLGELESDFDALGLDAVSRSNA
eukprot:SAG22_NODE_22155_length_251_cov_0.671053_1_plen_59_part_10